MKVHIVLLTIPPELDFDEDLIRIVGVYSFRKDAEIRRDRLKKLNKFSEIRIISKSVKSPNLLL